MQVQTNTATINKIENLFRLSKGTHSQEEAQSAMLKAQELLLKYDLSMTDINLSEDSTNRTQRKEVDDNHTSIRRGRMPWWWRQIAVVIAKNMRCHTYFSWQFNWKTRENMRVISLIGLKQDVQVCESTIQFAIRAASQCWKSYKNQSNDNFSRMGGMNLGSYKKNDYMLGFIKGLEQKFREQVEEKGLILVKDALVKQTYAIKSKSFRKESSTSIKGLGDNQAYGQGYRDGSSLNKDRYIE